MKKLKGTTGYRMVRLRKDQKGKTLKIHRLMAEVFLPNPENKKEVNHKNGIKSDNSLENLERCTHKENMQHAHRVLGVMNPYKMLGKKGSLCPHSKKVNQYTKEGEFIKERGATMDIERELGIDNGAISKCCLGKRRYKSAGGYKREYA